MGLEFVGTFCAVSVCVGVDCTDFVDTFVTGFVGSGILGVDCKLGEGCVTSGCEVTVELGAVSSLEESVGKEETPERLLDLATSVVEAVPAVGASVALVVDGCVPSRTGTEFCFEDEAAFSFVNFGDEFFSREF